MALTSGMRCNFHSEPGKAALLGAKGGRRRVKFPLEELKRFGPPKTPAELAEGIAQTWADTRAGRIDVKTANALSCLGGCLLSVLKATDLEARMAAVEKFIAEEKQRESRRQN